MIWIDKFLIILTTSQNILIIKVIWKILTVNLEYIFTITAWFSDFLITYSFVVGLDEGQRKPLDEYKLY